MKRFSILAIFIGCLVMPVQARWFERSFETMGTKAKVEFELNDEKKAAQLIQAVVDEMERVNRTMSPFIETSELSMVNRSAAQHPVVISEELYTLIARSFQVSAMTRGAFDISFSSVGYLYDYRLHLKPDPEQIERLKSAIDYRRIQLNPAQNSIYFEDARIRIDLGGIAKGHAVDRCIHILQQAGVKNGFVNAGGDSRIIGKRTDRPWYIGIRHPRDDRKLIANLPLEDIALSTSGDYERFFEQDGVRYHHIIDPKTGDSARAVESATILASDSTTADALSTSIFILGVEEGMKLVNQLEGISAIMVDKHGKMFISEDLAPANE